MTNKELIKVLRKLDPKGTVLAEVAIPVGSVALTRKYHVEITRVKQETCSKGKTKFKAVWLS